MEKRRQSLPAATIAADRGLFIHLGEWRPTELDLLKNGSGRWMRRIVAATENWRGEIEVGAANIVAVVLLYRCRERGAIRFDDREPIKSEAGMRLPIPAPIVVELGDIEDAQVEELFRGGGKVLDETREVMRLVQQRVGDGGTARKFVPIVATYIASRNPRQLEEKRGLDEGDASVDAEGTLAIRYFRASRVRRGQDRNRITIA